MLRAGQGAEKGHVVVVGATNRPNGVESALRRPGRLEQEVCVELPDHEVRLLLLLLCVMQFLPTSSCLSQRCCCLWSHDRLQTCSAGLGHCSLSCIQPTARGLPTSGHLERCSRQPTTMSSLPVLICVQAL